MTTQRIHVVKSSIQNDGGISGKIIDKALEKLAASSTSFEIDELDLCKRSIPYITNKIEGIENKKEGVWVASDALSQELIERLKIADQIIIAVPMYNFGEPAMLKSYIDHIVVSGMTFTYTQDGPQGLIGNKPVFIVNTRGGIYDASTDYVTPWVKQVLGFIGFSQPEFIYAQGLDMRSADTNATINKTVHLLSDKLIAS